MFSRIKRKKSVIFSGVQMKLMLLPFLILFAVFTVLPVIVSMVISFFDYDVMVGITWAGLKNYIYMFFEDDVFKIALKNTLIFAVITGPLSFFLAFLLAWFINEFNSFTRSILSFLFYSPALMGNAYFIWQVLFSGDSYGYINSALISLGIITDPIQWLKTPEYIMPIIIIVQIWMGMGISFLSNIAGLQNVDTELYEAGAIDGIKNRWYELWYITLPYMKNILLFSAVMQIASSFSVGQICMTLAGFPSINYSAETLITHLTDVGNMRYEMGVACAMSFFLFGIMALSRIVIGKVLEKVGR